MDDQVITLSLIKINGFRRSINSYHAGLGDINYAIAGTGKLRNKIACIAVEYINGT